MHSRFPYSLITAVCPVLPALLACCILAAGCEKGSLHARAGNDVPGEQYAAVVETMVEVERADVIEIPLPPNPYEDDFNEELTCRCCCPNECGHGLESSEFTAFINELRAEATSRVNAVADALLKSGGDIMEYEEWQLIAKGCMELLSNPTIVIVQLPSGQWKKVKFEELGDMDVSPGEVFRIQQSVGVKMKAALKAEMISRGVPEPDADTLAGDILKTYLKNLLQ
ncbi:MAG: hypothetical protein ABIJ56_03000 [Pseudomonadota bacterium]